MRKAFKLHSNFKPSGDQPEAIHQLKEGLKNGLMHQTLLGLQVQEKLLRSRMLSPILIGPR